MLWDLFKIKLKELSSAYCKLRSKSKKSEVAKINDRLKQIEKDINRGNNTDKIKTERAEQKKSIIYLKSKLEANLFAPEQIGWTEVRNTQNILQV